MKTKFGYWTVDGDTCFAMMPGGVVPGIDRATPIKLQVGDRTWGAEHIQQRHGAWLAKNKETVASMVYKKLGQTGNVFSTGEVDKTKVSLALAPAALLILRYIPSLDFFSVSTLYFKEGKVDGTLLGRYPGRRDHTVSRPRTPIFAPPPRASGKGLSSI